MSRFLQKIINSEPGQDAVNKVTNAADISTDIPADMPIDIAATSTSTTATDTPADIATNTIEDISERIAAGPAATLITPISAGRLSAIPAEDSANRAADRPSDRPTYQTLDSTHTNSEKAIYSILYRETISKKRRTVEMSQTELRRATGIGGVNTIKRAVEGLVDKLSVRIVTSGAGSVVGTNYEVYSPQEIMAARRAVKMEIHHKTKKIVGLSSDRPAGLSANRPDSSTGSRLDRADNLERLDISETDMHDKYNINPTDKPLSSGSQRDDDEKFIKVRRLFEQLSGGGSWKDDRDSKSYLEIVHVPLWHVIMGLCYSVARSPEHKMSSLSYAVPSILEHFRQMEVFDASDMTEQAYRQMRKTLNCLATGKWTIGEWES